MLNKQNKLFLIIPYGVMILVTIYFLIGVSPVLLYILYLFTPYGDVKLLQAIFSELARKFELLILGYIISLMLLFLTKYSKKNNNKK
jgi:hypothetical protein